MVSKSKAFGDENAKNILKKKTYFLKRRKCLEKAQFMREHLD